MVKKLMGAVIGLGLLGGLGLLAHLLSTNKIVVGYNQGYMPDQPLPFSHQKHAGELKVDCRYCHTTASVSRHASEPSLNICMNCHMNIAKDSPALAQLKDAYANNKSIAWEKVHLLPDHVKFNHSAHVAAGKDCQTCHGPVESMPVVYQWSSLSMGWCVNCHRQPENNAPLNCSTCHY